MALRSMFGRLKPWGARVLSTSGERSFAAIALCDKGVRFCSRCRTRLAAALPFVVLVVTGSAGDTTDAARGSAGSHGTTYYVSADRGSDRNSGRSSRRPWRTLHRLRKVHLDAGDAVRFAAGETWNEPLLIFAQGSASAPVVIGSYGNGAPPVFTGSEENACVELRGRHVVLRGLRVSSCHFGIRIFGDDVRVTATAISNNAEGLQTEPGSSGAVVSRNTFMNNKKMVVNTPCSVNCNDDYGAVAVLISGNNGDFAHNTVTGSWALSSDYGHDGAAFEVFGGSGNTFAYNLARDNASFIELGCRCSTRAANGNKINYNVITSALPFAVDGIVAHGNEGFGPTNGTTVYNSSIYITSPSSQGLHCGSCTAATMKLRNNAVRMTGRGSGYNYSGADEDYDLLSGRPIRGGTLGAHSGTANPRFRSLTNLRLRSGSPAIKRGLDLGPTRDFTGAAVRGVRDIGAYKFRNRVRHRPRQ
jgi:hypothetical protein